MKYYLIAGEASGDLHGSNLLKAIKEKDPNAVFRIWGGDLMQNAGGQLVKHYKDLAFMGFLEVVKNLPTILNNFKFCKKDILEFQLDVLILIDYPGFNLRMAQWAKRQNIRVFYYISPQLWAWHSSRVYSIKKNVERMYVILPFEKDFYKKYDWEVDYVGHPLLDVIENQKVLENFHQQHDLPEKPIIALLPGSRRQEVRGMLKIMLGVVPQFSDYQFVIAGAPSLSRAFYEEVIEQAGMKNHPQISLVENQTYALLQNAKAALVTSGTATLETALFDVPQVVCYKGNAFSYFIARQLVDVKYISLVNLIMEEPVVKELIQVELTVENLREELELILNKEKREQIFDGYQKLREKLGRVGASKRTAKLMIKRLTGVIELR